mmetsp:Transcript_122916/g.213184  ORF Transcript_122916/g.213184 Transcript_122916/m.213184 type:complete len:209 (-) Transcript_122916:450-1076(-)
MMSIHGLGQPGTMQLCISNIRVLLIATSHSAEHSTLIQCCIFVPNLHVGANRVEQFQLLVGTGLKPLPQPHQISVASLPLQHASKGHRSIPLSTHDNQLFVLGELSICLLDSICIPDQVAEKACILGSRLLADEGDWVPGWGACLLDQFHREAVFGINPLPLILGTGIQELVPICKILLQLKVADLFDDGPVVNSSLGTCSGTHCHLR